MILIQSMIQKYKLGFGVNNYDNQSILNKITTDLLANVVHFTAPLGHTLNTYVAPSAPNLQQHQSASINESYSFKSLHTAPISPLVEHYSIKGATQGILVSCLQLYL